MLCQASTATVFSSCLFLGHFPFSFVFSKWNACSIGFRSGDWLGHCITVHFFPFKNSLVAFAVCFGSLSICTVKRRPMSSEAFGWIWADNIARNTSEFILLLLSAVTSSINTREPVPLAAIHAHAMTLPPPCFTDEVVCLGLWAVPFLLYTLLFPSLWYKLILVSSVHRMLFQNCEGFFRCRLANSNLAFLFLRLTNGLHLVVNPLYSLWWSLLLIVDFDTHTPTSWRVFLIWPTVVNWILKLWPHRIHLEAPRGPRPLVWESLVKCNRVSPLVVDTLPCNEAASSCTSNREHHTGHFYIFNPLVSPDPKKEKEKLCT